MSTNCRRRLEGSPRCYPSGCTADRLPCTKIGQGSTVTSTQIDGTVTDSYGVQGGVLYEFTQPSSGRTVAALPAGMIDAFDAGRYPQGSRCVSATPRRPTWA